MDQFAVHQHNETVLQSLTPGDLIEFPRVIYSHWGVYVGFGKVIHLSGENYGIGDDWLGSEKAEVREDEFYKVANYTKAQKNNSKDATESPFSASEIVSRARSVIGRIGYNVIVQNCEHFANWCRYGIPSSQQVDDVVAFGRAVLTAGTDAFAFLVYPIIITENPN